MGTLQSGGTGGLTAGLCIANAQQFVSRIQFVFPPWDVFVRFACLRLAHFFWASFLGFSPTFAIIEAPTADHQIIGRKHRPCRPRLPHGKGTAIICGAEIRDALEGKGLQSWPPKQLDRRLEQVAKAGGRYCQLPLKLAFTVRETVVGHRLGALEVGGGGAPPPLLMHPYVKLVTP